MSTRTIHMSLDIRGAIWNRRFEGFKNDDGSVASRMEAFDFLCDHLALGHKQLPMSRDCEGFDYQTGCPGHEVEESNP